MSSKRPEALQDLPKYISWIPQGGGSGLYVRIDRDGTEHRKFYALSRFKTAEDCLGAARFWRDIKLQELGFPQPRPRDKRISAAKTRTGMQGVGISVKESRASFRVYGHVQRISDNNWARNRSLHKHGIDGAAAQLARELVESHPVYEGLDPKELGEEIAASYRELLTEIYRIEEYPSNVEEKREDRLQAVEKFVEEDDTLPLQDPFPDR